ncbi:MAG: PPK2 family polyphosphate kinase [Bacteroidota bacterium]
MISLRDISTLPPEGLKKDDVKSEFKKLQHEIADLQNLMYAHGKYSFLVVLQSMDAGGKDGTTRDVFNECSAVSLNVASFKAPTKLEMAHDFLWRIHKEVPRKGEIKVFNRSHYEDVLIQRVYNWIDDERAIFRFKAINAFEELLAVDNDTIILKFFLYMTKDKQKEELLERIDQRDKHYKHADGDWEHRPYWEGYMEAYEDVINHCNQVPWHIVPSDKGWYRNLFVARKVAETLRALPLEYPDLDKSTLHIPELGYE